jgi:hypothetical protein
MSESDLIDHIDLMKDEFLRIIAFSPSDEIKNLCERAIKNIDQSVPVIKQRDQALKELGVAVAALEEIASDKLKFKESRVARERYQMIARQALKKMEQFKGEKNGK